MCSLAAVVKTRYGTVKCGAFSQSRKIEASSPAILLHIEENLQQARRYTLGILTTAEHPRRGPDS